MQDQTTSKIKLKCVIKMSDIIINKRQTKLIWYSLPYNLHIKGYI